MTTSKRSQSRPAGDAADAELRTLVESVRKLGDKAMGLWKAREERWESEKLHEEFKALVAEATSMGEKLNNFQVGPRLGATEEASLDAGCLARLSFCGYLEGDFAERSYLQMPIILSGGFFLHTECGNILFDPGMGTLVGMRELGIGLARETHAAIVSHYHPSARFDLHTLLNELGGYCPGRADGGSHSARPTIPLFCSKALSEGRNGHPAALIPSDLRVVRPFVALPDRAWYLRKGEHGFAVVEAEPADLAQPRNDALLLRTFPAYHRETVEPDGTEDRAGMEGAALSAFFLETPEYGILFTGDTEYPRWDQSLIESLRGRVTVLVANMKTLEYLACDEHPGVGSGALRRTRNQLGFQGARELAAALKPQVLVLRALGLECVVREAPDSRTLHYVPERLSIYQRVMQELLKKDGVEHVIIPGRHRVLLWRDGSGAGIRIEEEVVVPAFPKTGTASFGVQHRRFMTANQALAKEIRGHIAFLRQAAKGVAAGRHGARPFLVLEGESGGGKTQLAHAIASELLGRDKDRCRRLIKPFDLATVGSDSNVYSNILFGWRPRFFHQQDRGHDGLFGTPGGVLILNQLEKLPLCESQRFLDVIEDWNYKRHGEENEDQKPVQVTIIFTTNVSLIECTNLSPDVKNRLLPRRATVPSLSSLPLEERQRELRVFVTHWCRDNGVVLAPSILERLHEMDLSHGSFRTLRGVLESSRFLALSEFGLQQLPVDSATFNIGVAQEFFDEAMKRGQVSYRKPLEASQAGVPRELACLAAVWISYGCVAKNTYDKIRASRGASPPKFNEKLKGFCRRFASSEQAWAFFRDSDSAEERLRQGDLDGYLDCIGAAPERDIVGKLFQFDLVEERESWINRRTEELHLILFGQEGVSLREDTKRKFKKALDNAL